MAKLEITGTVHYVSETLFLTSKSGNEFKKRELILDTTRFDPYTGKRSEYENYPKFEFRGEKCSKLDGLNIGDVVKVFFDITGRFYLNKDNQQSHMNSVEGYDCEIIRNVAPQPSAPQYAPQYQQPIQQPVQQPQYPQQNNGFYPQQEPFKPF